MKVKRQKAAQTINMTAVSVCGIERTATCHGYFLQEMTVEGKVEGKTHSLATKTALTEGKP